MKSQKEKTLQKDGLENLVKQNGIKPTSTFVIYTSDEIGNYYVHSEVVQNDGFSYRKAIEQMASLIRDIGNRGENFEIISGGETRDWVFSNPVALNFALPHLMIYKDGKMLGPNITGKKVLHVADLNNEGSSPTKYWVPTIRKAGGIIQDIVFYVDRLEDGVQAMEKLGLTSRAVVPLDSDAWQHLLDTKVITPEVYTSIHQRMENKDDWARNMLRSEAGFQQLVSYLRNEKTTAKALRAIDHYKDIKGEITDRLKKEGLEIS